MTMTLVAHTDTNYVGRDSVIAVPTPPRTDTWGVIGHGQLVETLENAVVEAGYEIDKDFYSLSGDGGKMFGVFNLAPQHDTSDKAFSIGFRNSTNKTMSVGITWGLCIFVCDNLSFNGDFIKFRKHTGGLDLDELQYIAAEAIRSVGPRLTAFELWHKELETIDLTRTDKEALFVRSMEKNIVPFGKSKRFHRLFFEKKNDQNKAHYEDNLQGFHGAVTQLWGGQSLIGSGPRHKDLRLLLNEAKSELQEHGALRNAA